MLKRPPSHWFQPQRKDSSHNALAPSQPCREVRVRSHRHRQRHRQLAPTVSVPYACFLLLPTWTPQCTDTIPRHSINCSSLTSWNHSQASPIISTSTASTWIKYSNPPRSANAMHNHSSSVDPNLVCWPPCTIPSPCRPWAVDHRFHVHRSQTEYRSPADRGCRRFCRFLSRHGLSSSSVA